MASRNDRRHNVLLASWRLLALYSLLSAPQTYGAFTYTAPSQCEDLTVSWSGGSAPFSILLAPNLQTSRNITIPSSSYNGTHGTYTFQLPLPSQQRFVIVLSDGTGFGSLGTTGELTVNSADGSCDTSFPSPTFNIAYNATFLESCEPFTFNGYSGGTTPITVHGLIPQGTAFDIDIPSTSKSTYNWTTDVAIGTTLLFVSEDGNGGYATNSDFLGVGAGSTDSCINSSSPGTTTAAASSTTGTGTATKTSSSSTSATSSSGAGSGSTKKKSSHTGAIVGAVVGCIVGILIIALLLFFFLRRRNRQKKKAEGFDDGAFIGGSKGRNRNHIDLLPSADAAGAYPLATRPQGEGGQGGSADYEPVPYVLPPSDDEHERERERHSTTAASEGYDPHAAGRTSSSSRPLSNEMSTVGGASAAGAWSKSAMAALDRGNTQFAPNAPARFLVHEDAGSVEGGDDDEGEYSETEEVVDLPPQYNSLGVLVTPQRSVSRRRSARRPASGVPTTGAEAPEPDTTETTAEHHDTSSQPPANS